MSKTLIKHIYVSTFTLLLLFACNNRKKNVSREFFKITIRAKVLEDDTFQVFYIDGENKGYMEDKRIKTPVHKSQDFQEITFLLKSMPLKFRIDLGENRNESLIEIDKVILKYGNNQIELDSNVLHRFFEPNIYARRVHKGYHRMIVDNRYDPFISSTALLGKKLDLEFK